MGILIVFWRVICRVGPTQIGLLAAGVAFYALLAVFPAIAAVIALAGLVTEPDAVVAQLEGVGQVMPDEAADILLDQAAKVAGTADEGLTLALAFGVAFAIYLSTRATTGLIHGLNVVLRREEDRGFVVYWATVILLTAALLFGTTLLFVLLVVAPAILAFLPAEILAVETADALRAGRWLVVVLLFLAGLAVLYRFGPSGDRPRWLSPGLILASVLWFAGSFVFSLYVANFGYYNESFGSLGGVIILLTWLWLSAFFVLLGALFDAEYWRQRG